MEICLREIREKYGLSKSDFSKLIDMKEYFYSQYEEKGELPSKYVYVLWKSLQNFPVPDDFFFYTSFTLQVNMKYHNLTQMQIADLFDIANQSTISGYLKENIPMYEKKEYFQKFTPLIIPLQITQPLKKERKMKEITELQAKGNFILVEKRRLQKIRKNEAKQQVVF